MNLTAEIEISKLGVLGQGVGVDAGGNIYFVAGAVPGDLCRVSYERDSKRYRDAQLEELLRPSVDRVVPACVYFSECGGCDWLHLDYRAQLRAKEAILTHLLEKMVIQPAHRLPILGAETTLGYRTRVQLRTEGRKLGFYRRRSHEIVDIESCAVSHPKINEAISRLRRTVAGEGGGRTGKTKVELALDSEGNLQEVTNRAHASAGFSQIHMEQNARLKDLLRQWVVDSGSRRVLELFAGDGNLTAAYAFEVEKVFALEWNQNSIDRAEVRKRSGEIPETVDFIASGVNARVWSRVPADFADRCDTLIIDPPRTGVGVDLAQLCHPSVKTFIYISCSPVTFSHDVQRIKNLYRLDRIAAIDMFPQTRHVEIASVWVRR